VRSSSAKRRQSCWCHLIWDCKHFAFLRPTFIAFGFFFCTLLWQYNTCVWNNAKFMQRRKTLHLNENYKTFNFRPKRRRQNLNAASPDSMKRRLEALGQRKWNFFSKSLHFVVSSLMLTALRKKRKCQIKFKKWFAAFSICFFSPALLWGFFFFADFKSL